MKKFLLILLIVFNSATVNAEPVLLGLHVLLNGLATKYLPGHEPTSYHGPYIGLNYGWKYELSDLYKVSSSSEGSDRGSAGATLGYQFLRTESWDFSVEIFRQLVDYKDKNNFEGEDTIDGFGFRLNYGILALKFGYAIHGFKDSANYYDGGYYTGFGLEYVLQTVSVYFELTDYYVGDRNLHIAGFDVGIKYFFDMSTGNR